MHPWMTAEEPGMEIEGEKVSSGVPPACLSPAPRHWFWKEGMRCDRPWPTGVGWEGEGGLWRYV